jgi:aminopeptidase N
MCFIILKLAVLVCVFAMVSFAQTPAIEPGVPLELAKWRAARYSDVRYKLNLTLEKMSPVLKGTIEIRVKVGARTPSSASSVTEIVPIILDWRKIRGSEERSAISNIFVNGKPASVASGGSHADEGVRAPFEEINEHLIFREGVVIGENVIKLDFTSPILTSGSAITRYVDKEDGTEYLYSLFVPSDASTAFPAFDQPDLKARFQLSVNPPDDWTIVSNSPVTGIIRGNCGQPSQVNIETGRAGATLAYSQPSCKIWGFSETKPISTYVFAFAAGPFTEFSGIGTKQIDVANVLRDMVESGELEKSTTRQAVSPGTKTPPATAGGTDSTADPATSIYVRKSQAAKFKPHAAEVFRLNREAIKYFESYFDYKFPFPKYDLVLIPEFPFGGMEHAGATFLRESSIIFPQEPTKNDYISRATLIFHEAAHQWFGDTVTMRWFDDLWLKEGFATFTAYKAMEKIMPEYNAWKVFYERVKQAAYQTDSTKGTTPIYQEIKNLSAAKSAYGAIVYNKAPAFLRQAEFYLGEDKFQTAVRAFLKKHEFGNAGWEDLVKEFEKAGEQNLQKWAQAWVMQRGLPVYRPEIRKIPQGFAPEFHGTDVLRQGAVWSQKTRVLALPRNIDRNALPVEFYVQPIDLYPSAGDAMLGRGYETSASHGDLDAAFVFPNYQDYGYGIFLLDPMSRDYVLKNIGKEKDDFLRTMIWGALWDSVREAEMDPREYVDLVVKELKTETDESTIQTLLSRVSTAMRYYLSEPGAVATGSTSAPRSSNRTRNPVATAPGSDLQTRLETLLIDRMQNAPTPGQKITYYRAFLSIGSSANARRIMKEILKKSEPRAVATGPTRAKRSSVTTSNPVATAPGSDMKVSTKDRFDIVQRLIILGDPDAPKLLADLERTETSDDAKRYAYAAKAGIPTAESKAKFWNDFVNNKDLSESWIEAAFGPFNNIRHAELTLPYLERALKELPNHKRNRKIFFVNGWLGAFIGGQKSEQALAIINKFLADNPDLDRDLRLKILENADIIERAVKIRAKY